MLHQLLIGSLILCSAALLVSDELKPIRQWKGVHPDLPQKDLCPDNQPITDEDQLEKVWRAWRPDDAIPQLDFANDIIVVATAHGPNQVLVNGLRIENGDLKFTTGSTRMAGPGFGYTMLQIPCAGIKTVNGAPLLPAKTQIAESIEVTIVGRITSGVMAIGGETTGTTIAANNITWELDLQGDAQLVESVNQLGQSMARVTGTLIKKPGVEIRGRMIVLVDTITALADESTTPGHWSIEIVTSGGIAGISEMQTIDSSGAVKNIKKRQRVTESWKLSAEKLGQLGRLIATTDWDSLPAKTRAPNVADMFQYEVSINVDKGQKTYRFSIDEPSTDKYPAVKQLFKLTRKKRN